MNGHQILIKRSLDDGSRPWWLSGKNLNLTDAYPSGKENVSPRTRVAARTRSTEFFPCTKSAIRSNYSDEFEGIA
jgi:hypothetical protein